MYAKNTGVETKYVIVNQLFFCLLVGVFQFCKKVTNAVSRLFWAYWYMYHNNAERDKCYLNCFAKSYMDMFFDYPK